MFILYELERAGRNFFNLKINGKIPTLMPHDLIPYRQCNESEQLYWALAGTTLRAVINAIGNYFLMFPSLGREIVKELKRTLPPEKRDFIFQEKR